MSQPHHQPYAPYQPAQQPLAPRSIWGSVPWLAWVIGAAPFLVLPFLSRVLFMQLARSKKYTASELGLAVGIISSIVLIITAAAIAVVIVRRLAERTNASQQGGRLSSHFIRVIGLTLLVMLVFEVVSILMTLAFNPFIWRLDTSQILTSIVLVQVGSTIIQTLIGGAIGALLAFRYFGQKPPAAGHR